MCFDFLYNFCLEHFSFWEELSEIWSKRYAVPHVKYPLFLSDFNESWILSRDCRKNTQIPNFMKIRPVGTESFHVDGQPDTTKLMVAFRNFANAPKMWSWHSLWHSYKSGGICPEFVCRDFVVRESFVAASNFCSLKGTRAVSVAETSLNTINPQSPRS